MTDIKSERRPASDRNRWPASFRNAWPASSEYATSYPAGQSLAPSLADFTSEATYTVITNILSIPSFGDTSETIKVSTIDQNRVTKLKGASDGGEVDFDCAFSDADPGQMAIFAANADRGDHSFKIVFPNPGPTGKPTTVYFRAMVISAITEAGDANSFVKLKIKIAINSAPEMVPAS